MIDVVERLRTQAKYSPVDVTQDDCREAADEIERLRRDSDVAEKIRLEQGDEIERLRNELANEVDLGEMRLAEIERLREQFHYAVRVGQAARNDALEEAALVADGKAEKAVDFAPQIGRAAQEIAAHIRALKEEASD